MARRDVLDERHATDVEAEPLRAGRGRPARPRPKRNVVARRDRPRRPCRAQDDLRELLGRLESGERSSKRSTSTSSTPAASNSSSRRSSVVSSSTPLPEHRARMRVERHDRRPQVRRRAPPRSRGRCPRWTPSNVPIATARGAARELVGHACATFTRQPLRRARARRPPAAAAPASNASGVTASATENGPTSVRRSVTQCPPSASAIARMYVPRADAQVERSTAVACIRDDVERVDRRAPQRHLHLDARAAPAGTRAHRRSSPRTRRGSAARSRRGGARAVARAPPRPAARARSTTSPSGSPVEVRAVRSISVR